MKFMLYIVFVISISFFRPGLPTWIVFDDVEVAVLSPFSIKLYADTQCSISLLFSSNWSYTRRFLQCASSVHFLFFLNLVELHFEAFNCNVVTNL